jgi:hypothetical protein
MIKTEEANPVDVEIASQIIGEDRSPVDDPLSVGNLMRLRVAAYSVWQRMPLYSGRLMYNFLEAVEALLCARTGPDGEQRPWDDRCPENHPVNFAKSLKEFLETGTRRQTYE